MGSMSATSQLLCTRQQLQNGFPVPYNLAPCGTLVTVLWLGSLGCCLQPFSTLMAWPLGTTSSDRSLSRHVPHSWFCLAVRSGLQVYFVPILSLKWGWLCWGFKNFGILPPMFFTTSLCSHGKLVGDPKRNVPSLIFSNTLPSTHDAPLFPATTLSHPQYLEGLAILLSISSTYMSWTLLYYTYKIIQFSICVSMSYFS